MVNRFTEYIGAVWREAGILAKILLTVVILFVLIQATEIVSFYINVNSGGLETVSGEIHAFSFFGAICFLLLLFILIPVCFIVSLVKICNPANLFLTGIAIAIAVVSFNGRFYLRDNKFKCKPEPDSMRCIARNTLNSRTAKEVGLRLQLLKSDRDMVFTREWKEQFSKPGSMESMGNDFVLNSSLLDIKLSQIPDNVVVIFESDVPRGNVIGGPNDISTWWHYGKGCLIVFGDGRVEFVRKEKFKDLRWQP